MKNKKQPGESRGTLRTRTVSSREVARAEAAPNAVL